jgi:hypothetical protein
MRIIIFIMKSSGKKFLSESGQIVLEAHVTSYVESVLTDYLCVCACQYHSSKTISLFIFYFWKIDSFYYKNLFKIYPLIRSSFLETTSFKSSVKSSTFILELSFKTLSI